jgi:hypothetical protein
MKLVLAHGIHAGRGARYLALMLGASWTSDAPIGEYLEFSIDTSADVRIGRSALNTLVSMQIGWLRKLWGWGSDQVS